VFNTLASQPGSYNDDDRTLANAMADAWVRFAKTGNPNGGSLPAWPQFDATNDAYLEFGDTVHLGTAYRNAALDFVGQEQAKAKLTP
jgi:para-nitrobenzyl esterase